MEARTGDLRLFPLVTLQPKGKRNETNELVGKYGSAKRGLRVRRVENVVGFDGCVQSIAHARVFPTVVLIKFCNYSVSRGTGKKGQLLEMRITF